MVAHTKLSSVFAMVVTALIETTVAPRAGDKPEKRRRKRRGTAKDEKESGILLCMRKTRR